MCDLCYYDNNEIHNDNLNVCKDCYRSDDGNLLTKTDAMKNYALNNNDLNNVRHISYSKRYYTVYLYLIKDLEFIAITKYGSIEGLENKLEQKALRSKKLKITKKTLREQRTQDLDIYLKSLGLSGIRGDSTLCQKYIDGNKITKEYVGTIMIEMQFYYDHTNYSNYIDYYIEQEREYKGYYDIDEVRDSAKSKALKNYLKENKDNPDKLKLVPPSLTS